MTNILRSLSDTAPLQSARVSLPVYYDPGASIDEYSRVLGTEKAMLVRASRRYVAALYVIFKNAMRASEYLSARAEDILGNDRLFIRGKKGSRSYIVELPGIGIQFKEARSVNPARFVSGCTYRQLYNACIAVGIGDRVQSRENIARTHAARYRIAAELATQGVVAVADCLRHRSQRSTLHYMPRGG